MPSLPPKRSSLSVLGALLVFLLIFADPGNAALVTFPSGETFDLTFEQLHWLKQQPGIFYVGYPSQTLIPAGTTERAVVQVPETLGGGFLIAFAEDFQRGLAAVDATPAAPPSSASNAYPSEQRHVRFEFALEGGYRIDQLKWSIAGYGPGNTPNILSELTWKDLEIYQLKLSNTTVIKERLYLRGYAAYGWIQSGDNRDSDYAGNDRTFEFSRSDNATDDDDVLDGSLGLGYRFAWVGGRFQLAPLIGYSYHEQNLRITDGYQTIPPTGSFEGLNSTYETRWHGPWIGLDFKAQTPPMAGVVKRWLFFTGLELHYADYYAKANWNLRDEFAHPKSFEHDADGYGLLFKIGTQLFFSEHWALNLAYDYAYWKVEDGTDHLFLADGTSVKTPLNEVVWRSHLFSIGVACQF